METETTPTYTEHELTHCQTCGRGLGINPHHAMRLRQRFSCGRCTQREIRRKEWADANTERLIDKADSIGVGKLFCRNDTLPTYDDAGLAEQIKARPLPSGGLLIVGPVGTHKTHLLAARTIDAARRGFDARLVRWTTLLAGIRRTYNSEGNSEQHIIDEHTRLDYLALDDFGIGRDDREESEFGLRIAFEILDRRYADGSTIDIASNLTPDEIATRFDERVARRIRELTTVYAMRLPEQREVDDGRA